MVKMTNMILAVLGHSTTYNPHLPPLISVDGQDDQHDSGSARAYFPRLGPAHAVYDRVCDLRSAGKG